MKKLIVAIIAISAVICAKAQTFTGMDENGNMTQIDSQGNAFNPRGADSTKQVRTVPKGIYVWRVDRKLGDIIKTEVDTLPHLYPNTTLGKGITGSYNTIGSNYTARQSRIFIDRPSTEQFIFTQNYSQVQKSPEQVHFTNTLSPITNLSYDNCGNKTDGEDHLDAKFAVNAGKRTGFGFDLDYAYARGYYQNQSMSHFNATLYGSHLGDKYQLHVIFQKRHQKATENGGITNDDYITHPELFSESFSDNEIPVTLQSNWNRNNSTHFFLTHRYNVGFYRDVKMTDEEIEARKFAEKSAKQAEDRKKREEKAKGNDEGTPSLGRPANAKIAGDELIKKPTPIDSTKQASLPTDSLSQLLAQNDTTRIRVDSKAMADSLIALEQVNDTVLKYMKKEFVPVTSFIHTLDYSQYERIYQAYDTPAGYYAKTFYKNYANTDVNYPGDSIYDTNRHTMIRNTVGIALLEGFNKWAKSGIKGFVTHELRKFTMPQLDASGLGYLEHWSEHNVSLGGRLSKTQGHTFHYDVTAETWLAGEDIGQFKVDFSTDLNFPLWNDTVRLAAKAYIHNLHPTFFERNYHSKHIWWDENLDNITRTRVEGIFLYEKTKTKLRVAIEEIKNFTYFGMNYNANSNGPTNLSATIKQNSDILNIMTAQLSQDLALGPIHWDNVVTYQTTSNSNVVPLPTFNLFTNLYLKFVYAHVLSVELGGCATYFTSYNAPEYVPQLSQYAIQENSSIRTSIGGFPIVDIYANLHLKHARFFVMMNNITASSGNKMSFLTPHYPLNRSVLHMGVSWNFFN